MALESFRGSLRFLVSKRGMGFNPGLFPAPAERPVLSHRQEQDLSHIVVTFWKLKHRCGLCPHLNGQMHTDFNATALS
jgi:hypothetical protein